MDATVEKDLPSSIGKNPNDEETAKGTRLDGPRSHFSPHRVSEIERLYRSGRAQSEVGKERRELGIVTRKGPSSRFSEQDVKRMASLYENGLSCAEIAKEFSCSRPMVRVILVKNGVPMRSRGIQGRVPEADRRSMLRLHEEGRDPAEIAATFSLPLETVRTELKKCGVEFPKTVSQREGRRILELHKKRATAREIAAEIGCSEKTVRNTLREAGVRSSRGKRGFSPEDRLLMAKMYENGQTTEQIAERFGCSQQTVGYNLRKQGIVRSRGRRTDLTSDLGRKIIDLCNSGGTIAEIAKQVGCGSDAVRYFLRKQGIPPPESKSIGLSPEVCLRIAEMHRQGLTQAEMATGIDGDINTVRNHLQKNGMACKPGRRGTSSEERQEMLDMYEQGIALSVIAERFGCCTETVRYQLRKMNITLRDGRSRKSPLKTSVDIASQAEYASLPSETSSRFGNGVETVAIKQSVFDTTAQAVEFAGIFQVEKTG